MFIVVSGVDATRDAIRRVMGPWVRVQSKWQCTVATAALRHDQPSSNRPPQTCVARVLSRTWLKRNEA